MLLALVVTSLFMATSICGALRNYVEAMSGEDFGHNWSKFECFKVQLVTCCDLLSILNFNMTCGMQSFKYS